jgi:hypothetical protein
MRTTGSSGAPRCTDAGRTDTDHRLIGVRLGAPMRIETERITVRRP